MRRMTRQKGKRKIYVDGDNDDDDDDDDEMMVKRWVCTGKNPLHLFRVREFQDLYAANKWIISMLSSLEVIYYWILFRSITANGCHQRNFSTFTYF